MIESDGYYIGTKEQCKGYNALVSAGENYGSVTVRWADVKEHPNGNQFAIIKHKSYDDETMQFVKQLSDDWFPDTDIIV